MINQATQQFKPNSKGISIVSLILGIISVINGAGPIYNLFGGKPRIFIDDMLVYIYRDNLIAFLAVTFLISAIGIILGKIGLKSSRRKFAIAGIILSIIGLLGAVFFYLFIKMMASTF